MVAAIIALVIGVLVIGYLIVSLERRRLESIRQTIIDSGKTDLTGVLSMYPEEMYDEVTEVYRKLYGSSQGS